MPIDNNEDAIKTFVVFDLETNGLPNEQFNTCSITELSMYAFSTDCLNRDNVQQDIKETGKKLRRDELMDGIACLDDGDTAIEIPELPRVLHKLTLMINPMRMIFPESERITGLSNDMLCNEAPFNKTTANCVLAFLRRLEKPICFVAHNGWKFDYPIIKYVFEKNEKSIPSTIYCVDSFQAFIEMDEKQEDIKNLNMKPLDELTPLASDLSQQSTTSVDEQNNESNPLLENDKIDWQAVNEITPQRKTKAVKRKLCDDDSDTPESSKKSPHKAGVSFKSRRKLFSKPFQPKFKYPPKDKFKLGNIYERVFGKPPTDLHRAESDVMILTKLILHYGLDFLAYAEERKVSFDEVNRLGEIS
ncbi:uncharacterized protein LOC133325518 [Musca vetustissima]|uniref:uncharacterized protein LOC133325518 n=1 Tax=Musca vetustissima TaxID=27455 RepID=UPI002AB74A75|nr:uncharacterized protein LOC133325518 [Musca vetustissima]